MAISKQAAGRMGYEKNKVVLLAQAEKKHVEAVRRYEATPKVCRNCATPLVYEDRRKAFCNHRCSASHNNGNRGPMGKGLCRTCNAPISRKNKFCAGCRPASGRPSLSLAQALTDNTRRRILVRERGHCCEVCGLSEWQNQKMPLQLDHIDGNSDHNESVNLRLICPNCHAQTPTFCNKNRGNKDSRRNVARRSRYHVKDVPSQLEGRATVP